MRYSRLGEDGDDGVEIALAVDVAVAATASKDTDESTPQSSTLLVGSQELIAPHIDYPLPPDDQMAPRLPRNVFMRNIFAMTMMTFVMECSRGMFIASLWLMVQHTGGSKVLNSSLVALFRYAYLTN
jgi:hypothetical protein